MCLRASLIQALLLRSITFNWQTKKFHVLKKCLIGKTTSFLWSALQTFDQQNNKIARALQTFDQQNNEIARALQIFDLQNNRTSRASQTFNYQNKKTARALKILHYLGPSTSIRFCLKPETFLVTENVMFSKMFSRLKIFENAGFSSTCGRTKTEVLGYDDFIYHLLLALRFHCLTFSIDGRKRFE